MAITQWWLAPFLSVALNSADVAPGRGVFVVE
jgi:hypothetical protein